MRDARASGIDADGDTVLNETPRLLINKACCPADLAPLIVIFKDVRALAL